MLLNLKVSRQRLAKAAELYLAWRVGRVAPRTMDCDRERLKPLLQVMGSCRLDRISADDITRYQQTRLAGGLAGRTVNIEVGLLRRILKRAKLWTSLAGEIENLPERSTVARVLSPAEKERLFATAAANPRWIVAYSAAEIASATTCRKVELRHVRWHDVDFEKTLLYVLTTKGRTAGVRVIPLNKVAVDAFRRLLQRAQRRGVAAPEHYVFPKRDAKTRRPIPNSPMPREAWQAAWRSLTRKAGLARLRFHDLRHLAITELSENGTPDAVVMALSGHASRQMLDRYTHIRMPAMREAVDALGRAGASVSWPLPCRRP